MMIAPDAPSPADKTISDEAQQIYANSMFGRAWTVSVALFAFAGISAPFLSMLPARQVEYGTIFLVFLPLFLCIVSFGIGMARETIAERKLTQLLRSDYRELRQDVSSSAIAPLLVIIEGQRNDDLFPTLMALLSDLLKELQEEDAVVLTEAQRQVLHELVEPGKQDATVARYAHEVGEAERRELRPSIIRALAWLGNSSSIPVLERIVDTSNVPALRQAALQSLEQIRERLQNGPEQLLRASRAPERPETLLRAVLADTPQNRDPQQLLRADNADIPLTGKNARQQTEEQATSVSNEASCGIKPK